jgi:tetratricopeptide repeat protein 8
MQASNLLQFLSTKLSSLPDLPNPWIFEEAPNAIDSLMGSSSKPSKAGPTRSGTRSGRPATASIRPSTASVRPATSATKKSSSTDIDALDVSDVIADLELSNMLFTYLVRVERNLGKALELAHEGIKVWKDALWRRNAGTICALLNMPSDAENHFKQALSLDPNDIFTLRELARLYYKQENFTVAIDCLIKITKIIPLDGGTVKICLARLYEIVGDEENALLQYKNCLSVEPYCTDALIALGANHFYKDEPEVALKYFQRVLELDGSNSENWNNLALAAFYSNQTDIAFKAFQQALAFSETDADSSADAICRKADVHFNLGTAGLALGDFDLAYKSYKTCLECNPKHYEAANNLGVIIHEHALAKESMKYFRQSVGIVNGIVPTLTGISYPFEGYLNLGILCIKQGMISEGHKMIKKALEISPQNLQAKHLMNDVILTELIAF